MKKFTMLSGLPPEPGQSRESNALFNEDGTPATITNISVEGGYLLDVPIDPDDYREPAVIPRSPEIHLRPWCIYGSGAKLDVPVGNGQVKMMWFVDDVAKEITLLNDFIRTATATSFDGESDEFDSGLIQFGLWCPPTIPGELRLEIDSYENPTSIDGYSFSLIYNNIETAVMPFALTDPPASIEAAIATALSDAGIVDVGIPIVTIEDLGSETGYVHIRGLDLTVDVYQMNISPPEANGGISFNKFEEIPARTEPFVLEKAVLRLFDLGDVPFT